MGNIKILIILNLFLPLIFLDHIYINPYQNWCIILSFIISYVHSLPLNFLKRKNTVLRVVRKMPQNVILFTPQKLKSHFFKCQHISSKMYSHSILIKGNISLNIFILSGSPGGGGETKWINRKSVLANKSEKY